MKKVKILTVVGVIALIIVLLVVMVTLKSAETENGVMSRQEAERRVKELKQKIVVPIDDATREKIDGLVNDLALEHEYTVEFKGQKYSVAWKAGGDLRRIGKAAVPQLIDAAANHNNPKVRQSAVSIVYGLSEKRNDIKLLECVPVFARSMYDEDVEVRGTAMCQIGNMARLFYRRGRHEQLEQLIPYLVKALRDKEERMRSAAAGYLFRVGRKDLIPEELITKYGIGQESW